MNMKKLAIAGVVLLLATGCSVKRVDNGVKAGEINLNLIKEKGVPVLRKNNVLTFKVVGQGVAPLNTISPAQASALAKRAAIADAYRQLAEKIAGVKVEGRDKIVNMVTKKSLVRTCVNALIKNATVIDSVTKDGLYEVEMEIKMYGKKWYPLFAAK